MRKKQKRSAPHGVMTRFIVLSLALASLGFIVYRRVGIKPADGVVVLPEAPVATASVIVAKPDPTPEPTPEAVLEQVYDAVFNGKLLQGGICIQNEIQYSNLDEIASNCNLQMERKGDTVTFPWRKSTVTLTKGSDMIRYEDTDIKMDGEVFENGGILYVPLVSFCNAIDVSTLWDEGIKAMYCTPSAGDWDLPTGYKVPVFMYHCVGEKSGDELYVSPSDMEAQIKYLLDNGYTPIFFEDLENVDKYEKPVILTYDDGYGNNYTNLWPLVQKYQVKVTIFMIVSAIGVGDNLMYNQISEMNDSGLVMIESHTINHRYLDELSYEDQKLEIEQSKFDIMHLTAKEPAVLCYPAGKENADARGIVADSYRFGVKMSGPTYVTGDDPTLVYRIYITNADGVSGFAGKLQAAYN